MESSPERTPLSHADTAWYRLEAPDNPVDITAVLELDGELDLARLRKTIEARLLRFERFRQRIVESPGKIGAPAWELDPEFSLDRHIERVSLGTRTLAELVGERASAPLPMDRPLWQIVAIDGAPGGTVLLTRLHHCIADGFALVRVMLSLADDGLSADAPPHDDAHQSLGERIVEGARDLASHPSHARDLARDTARAAASLGHLVLLPFERDNALRRPLSGVRRVAWSAPTPLARIKAIGRAGHGTVNDVLLGALTGALRRYLAAEGDALDAGIRAIVPVNLRPVRSIEEMQPVLGNRFGLVFLELPVHAASARERLELLERDMNRLKASEEPVVAFGILVSIGAAPAVIEHVVAEIFGRKASLVVTNVPGPRAQLSFAGSAVRSIVFWVPHPAKLGVGVSILSYAGNVVVGVRTDTAVIAEPVTLVRLFEEELRALEAGSG